MIVVTCKSCKENIDVSQEGYLEINLSERVMYFKCPKCKKTDKFQMYREDQKLAKARRL